ncbi:MAG: hypothetical protein GY799_11795, partial [Desulfobulbaceae bacterium]|nr:hypothetical protein [Desulfobulbaceae bacterium]
MKNQNYIPYALRKAFQHEQQKKAGKTWVDPRKKIFVMNHYPGLEVGRQLNVGEGSQESFRGVLLQYKCQLVNTGKDPGEWPDIAPPPGEWTKLDEDYKRFIMD